MRPPKKLPDKETEKVWAKTPANYKLGMFYFNKQDQRLLIRNWDGPYKGRTNILNFARPSAIILFAGVTLVGLALLEMVIFLALNRST